MWSKKDKWKGQRNYEGTVKVHSSNHNKGQVEQDVMNDVTAGVVMEGAKGGIVRGQFT